MSASYWKLIGIILLVVGVLALVVSQLVIGWRHKKALKQM